MDLNRAPGAFPKLAPECSFFGQIGLSTLLTHASICVSLECKSSNCMKMKAMLIHEKGCVITAKGGCFTCKRVWALLHDHVEQCTVEECRVPHCVAIRERGCDGRGRKVFVFLG